MDFDIFRVEHVDSYVGLQTFQSIEKVVQPTIVMGVCHIKATSVMAKDSNHTRQQSVNESSKELDISFVNEN
jgi:hypothetical protein